MTRRDIYLITLLCLLISCSWPTSLRAQEVQPYTLDQVVRLLESGVFSDNRIIGLAQENCIAFMVQGEAVRTLLSAGASVDLLNGLSEACVELPLTWVAITPAELEVLIGSSSTLRAQALGPDSTQIPNIDFEWAVEDTSIAEVSADGLVAGKAAGETRVIARSAEGLDGSALVRVTEPAAAATPGEEEPTDSLVGGKSVGAAAALGIMPGGGELYVGNTAKGVVILVGAAAAVAVGALLTSEDTTNVAFTSSGSPGGPSDSRAYPVDVETTIEEKNYIVVGAAVAGALWLYGLIDGIMTAKRSQTPPAQDEADGDPGLSLQLLPIDGIRIAPAGFSQITLIRIKS
jgi:hypothetical protein